MDTQLLYDFSPVLRLMLMGMVLALGPLAWVWLRQRQTALAGRLRALTLLTLFLTFDLVLFGAFTRLTDSGLGCPDWPGCYGQASPVGARAEITAAQTALPSGPVTHGKAWVEMIHRYLATAVGVLILVLAVASWYAHLRGKSARGDEAQVISRGWSSATLLWVCIQGAFGALTVTMKLFPAIVTMHLLGGVLLLSLLCVQAVRHAQTGHASSSLAVSAGLRALLWSAFALLWLQIALGAWVSTNYAVLACTEFPLCQNSWWPEMNFAQGFELWRALGLTADGQHIGFSALTAIHYTHRLMAYAVLALLGFLAWRMRQVLAWQSPARWLGWLLVLQFMTGLSNVVLGWPLLAAVLHTGGAAAMALVLTWALALAQRRAADTSLLPSSAARHSA